MIRLLRIAACALVLACPPAFAQLTLVLESDPGDPVGGGVNRTLTLADGTFTPTLVPRGFILDFNAGTPRYFGEFRAPFDFELAPGRYPFVQRSPYESETQAALAFFNFGTGCDSITGAFTVYEYVQNGSTVQSAAIDFEQHCNGIGPALRGKLRYNSAVALVPPFPIAHVRGATYLETGDVGTLDGSASYDPAGTAVTYAWSQLSGPTATLGSPSAATTTITAPAVPAGGANLVFQLLVTNGASQTNTRSYTVRVANPADPRTLFYVKSEPGDPVGQGIEKLFFPGSGPWSIAAHHNYSGLPYDGVEVYLYRGPDFHWNAIFDAPAGPLMPGEYPVVSAPNPRTNGTAALAVGECNAIGGGRSGHFTVHEIESTGFLLINKFAADFEQYCGTATAPLRGSVRFNSSVPLLPAKPLAAPRASVPVAEPGETVQVFSAGPGSEPLTYLWSQVSGPAAIIANPNAAATSFVAPAVPVGGADLMFELRVTRANGQFATARVNVHVFNPGDPRSFIHFKSEPGDYVGQGSTQTLVSPVTVRLTAGGIAVSNSAGDGGWVATFLPPVATRLQPGVYTNTTDTLFGSPAGPRFSFEGEGRSCNSTPARAVAEFRVWEHVISKGQVLRFAADFVQRCGASGAPIRGVIRYNSSVPLLPVGPVSVPTVADSDHWPTALVTLDGSRSVDTNGAALTYQWTQVSGPAVAINNATSAIATFTAPAVAAGGADLAFALTVGNASAQSDTATVQVRISNPADRQTYIYVKGDAGDLSGGDTYYMTPQNATFQFFQDTGVYLRSFSVGPGPSLEVIFRPGYGDLLPGHYPNASSSMTGGNPFFMFGGGSCNANGRFTVYEYVRSPTEVLRLAVDFEVRCGSSAATMRGSIRFNSAFPTAPFNPVAVLSATPDPGIGAPVRLDGTRSFDPNNRALSFAWTQVSGPPVTLATPNAAVATFTAPPVPVGGADFVFEAMVTNDAGAQGRDQVSVHIANESDTRTILRFTSPPGEYVGDGLTRTYPEGSVNIFPEILTAADGGITSADFPVSLGAPTFQGLRLRLTTPADRQLRRGVFVDAQRATFPPAAFPGLDFSRSGRSCTTVEGRFVIHEAVRTGGVTRFAVDFEQRCNGAAPTLVGQLRYNTTVPLLPVTPVAEVVAPPSVARGATATLDASRSVDPLGTPLSYLWTQVSGPAVTLSDAAASVTTFVGPEVPTNGADVAFDVTVTNTAGYSETARVTVRVTNPTTPRMLLYLESEAGEPMGQGQTRTYTIADGAFTSSGNAQAVHITVSGGGGWDLDFTANAGSPLIPGVYVNAIRLPTANRPGILVVGGNRQCAASLGSFTVHEFVMVGSVVQRFSADFEQRCDGLVPALRGSIRYASAIAFPAPADPAPDIFRFNDAANVTPGAIAVSNAVMIAGIVEPGSLTVANGAYSIGCNGTFSTAPALIMNGQIVCVRHTAPLALAAQTTTTLTISGIAGTFRSTTVATLPANEDWDGDGLSNGLESTLGRNPFVKDNDVLGDAKLFAMQQYRDFLGREGDAGGISFYENLLNTSAADRAAIIESFFSSPEFSGTVSPIVRLYFATFLRIPDYDGLLFQVAALRSGTPLEVIAGNFTLSPEFQLRYGSVTDAAFVGMLYQNILGRTASQPEIDYHVARLASGVSRGAVLVGFSESAEYQQLSYVDVYVTMMYVGMLRRAPEQAGFDFWVDYMEAGNPGLALINGFLNSPEYAARFQ